MQGPLFESSVNSEGIETKLEVNNHENWFESSVNSEGIETRAELQSDYKRLRAV